MQQLKIEDLIKEKISFGPPDVRGFYNTKCQCCNDYKVRAGFKFEDGTIGYNCWNCGKKGIYEEFSGQMSKRFREILLAYDIEDSEISNVINTNFFLKKDEEPKVITLKSLQEVKTTTPTIQLPEMSFKLGHGEFTEYQTKLINYLESRCVDPFGYPFYFSLHERFADRIIIPFYRNNKLIYWQARTINPQEKKRYDNAPVGRDAVMFNMDRLHDFSASPLLVTEGIFDAMMFNGVALVGSSISEAKLELLKKSNRRLIFVLDKDKLGKLIGEKALEMGWEITFCPDGVNDLNDSVKKYGRTWTSLQLLRNIPKNATQAKLSINMNCK